MIQWEIRDGELCVVHRGNRRAATPREAALIVLQIADSQQRRETA